MDRSFQIGPPSFLPMVIRPDNNFLGIEIKDVRPGPFAFQVSVVNDRHLFFVDVNGGAVALVRRRNVQMSGYPEEDLRVFPDQVMEPDGRLGDKTGRVGVFVIGIQGSGERCMKEADRGQIPVTTERIA